MTVVLAGTLSGRGGIQTHLYWLARALLEEGHKVCICSLGPKLDEAELKRVGSLRETGKFEFLCPKEALDGTTHGPLRTAFMLSQSLRSLAPDVYMACGTGLNLFLPALMSCACSRLVFHEVMSGHSFGSLDSRQVVRFGFGEVVAQATPVAATFRESFHWKRPIPVLPAFPEPLEITAQLPLVRTHSVEAGKVRAAFFSRLVPHKGALWLVQQWPRLAEWLSELHIYGTGPDEKPIRDLIASEGYEQRVFCHGSYPDGQAYADLLATFDLTLLPTVGSEGAPLVLLESMACAVPFVAYGVGGIPDYTNPDCEVLEPNSPDAFIEGVQRIALKLSAWKIDRTRLQNFYLEHFSYSSLKAKWLSFLLSSDVAG